MCKHNERIHAKYKRKGERKRYYEKGDGYYVCDKMQNPLKGILQNGSEEQKEAKALESISALRHKRRQNPFGI